MTTRQWLSRARNIDREINALNRTKDDARARLTHITQSYDSDGAQSTKDPHKFDRLIELEGAIDEAIDKLCKAKSEITSAIQQLDDGRQRTVLLDYYVRCISLEQIAVEMSYAYRTVKRLHKAGIAELDRIGIADFYT